MSKRKKAIDRDFVVKPYLINSDLKKRKKQPKFVVEEDFKKINYNELLPADWFFMKTCRYGGQTRKLVKTKEVNCRLLHHRNPYLRLGPFKEEQKSERPYAVVFHDILSDIEMNYLVEESRPNLSRERYGSSPGGDDRQDALAEHEFKDGNKVKIVHKTGLFL